MIHIGSSDNPRAVQGAADYFKTQGVDIELKTLDGKHVEVWVSDDDLELATTLWKEFLEHPYHEKYQIASWQAGDTEARFIYHGKRLNLIKRFKNLHVFLKSVCAVCLLIYLSLYLPYGWDLFTLLQFDPSSLPNWLTPALMHFSAIHLIFNLGWWLHLGDRLIKRTSAKMLLVLFVVSGLVSNWAQYFFVDKNFGGLSGVVYALLGYAWVYGARHTSEAPLVEKPIVGFMLIWMLVGFSDVLFINMANWAHLFGLLSGMLLGVFSHSKHVD